MFDPSDLKAASGSRGFLIFGGIAIMAVARLTGSVSSSDLPPDRDVAPRRRFARPALLVPLFAATILSASVVTAQSSGSSAKDPADWTEDEEGIPVTDALTIEKCGTCHAPDDKGNLSRISWIRATPEMWSQSIKRMASLNGMQITGDEARSITRYLGTWHGLAPEEAKPVMYMPERRIVEETLIPNDNMKMACASCHAFGQPLSSRRSKREWGLLQSMHSALYSQAEFALERPAGDQPEGRAEDAKPLSHGEVALAWLSENASLNTPEWSAWRPRIRTPRLGGKWLVDADLRGKGRYVGEMTITPAGDDFTTSVTLRSLSTGETLTRSGKGLVYAGYSWRGTSNSGAEPASPADVAKTLREAMWFSPDQSSAEGRWYWGEYHEFGLDVKMTRATGAPVLSAVAPYAVQTGAKGAQIHVYGDALPAGLAPADLDFGSGITVRSVSLVSPGEAVATVDVASDAMIGVRDVALGSSVLTGALPVFNAADYMKVTPETAMARLGGIKYAKGYEQFEAIAWSDGPDGKRGTEDDFAIMPIDASFTMQELPTVTYDDDVKFVGTLSDSGFFDPSFEGPNPERRFSRNNYGEVWAVATAKALKDRKGDPMTSRAYLVTTVPMYRRWDQPEVSQ